MNKRRWAAFFLLCALLTFLCTNGLCKKLWDAHWNPGEYTIELTQSDINELKALWDEIDRRSVGSGIREREKNAMEMIYKDYCEGLTTSAETDFEDVGVYHWEPGFPDENSLPRGQVFCLAVKALCEQYNMNPKDFLSYFPCFRYEVGYPENPTWTMHLNRYDDEVSSGLLTYKVQIQAYDGSILGIRRSTTVG